MAQTPIRKPPSAVTRSRGSAIAILTAKIMLGVALLSGILLAIAVAIAMASLPGFQELMRSPNGQAVQVRAADGSVLISVGPSYGDWLAYSEIPDIMVDASDGKFGPFAGQLFIGEFTQSSINRVFLEKVDGQYQGACFPFLDGFACGVLRLAFLPDGSLMVGETNRGWNSLGPRSWGLQRVAWTGRTPFALQTMQARALFAISLP